jgi:hypothetical protein
MKLSMDGGFCNLAAIAGNIVSGGHDQSKSALVKLIRLKNVSDVR